MLTGGSSSKNDLENSSSHEELSPLIDDEDANEQLPLKDIESFPRKKSSTFSSKSPDGESTPSDEKLGSSVTGSKATKNSAERKLHTDGGTAFSFSPNRNRESKDTTAIDIELQDNYLKTSSNRASDLAGILNRSNTNEVPNITVTMPSEESYELQGLEYGHRLASSNSANGLRRSTNDAIINVEMPQDLKDMSSRLFNICKRGDIVRFLEEINLLYEHEKNCLYDVLLLQNEKDQDTLLHVAIKGNNVDLVKEILHILGEPYNSDDAYECRYFKDKKENEKPLSKVINTKNREGKDVITLVIEGNNPECISAVFKYLTRKDINKRRDIESGYTPLHEAIRLKSSNAVRELLKSEHVDVELLDERSYKAQKYIEDKETAKLFINFYDDKITNLRKRLEDSNIQLEQARRTLHRRKSIFAYSAAISFCALLIGTIVNMAIGHKPPVSYVIGAFSILASPPGLMVFLIHRTDGELSRYREENSSLEKEFNNYREERYKVEKKLYDLRKEEVPPHTGANLVPPRGFQVTSVSGSVYSPEKPNIHIP